MNLKETIQSISEEFLAEAKKSPTLLADMAAMEKYMAESYSSRIIIELLQNADDAGASSVLVTKYNDSLIVANNGRPFSPDDVKAISRSGSSLKKRGETIGYRGVGFKSASFLSKDIVIVSNDTKFTFSQQRTAKLLSTSTNEVPTIRVPYLYEDNTYDNIVSTLVDKGYTTLFIFTNADPCIVEDELNKLSADLLLFLNHICSIEIAVQGKRVLRTERFHQTWGTEVVSGDQKWALLADNSIAISLANEILCKCQETDNNYYCFLPTLDKFLFPIKVNADFSTDPSRKHVILDDRSIRSIERIAKKLANIVYKAISTPTKMYKNVLTLFSENTSFSKQNLLLREKFEDAIKEGQKLTLFGGKKVNICEYKLFPSDFDDSITDYLRNESDYVKDFSLPTNVYQTIENVDRFIGQYSSNFFDTTDIVAILRDETFVGKTNEYIISYLLGKVIIGWHNNKYIESKITDISRCVIKSNGALSSIETLPCNTIREIVSMNENNIVISESTLRDFISELNIPYTQNANDSQLVNSNRNYDFLHNNNFSEDILFSQRSIGTNEWSSPEDICCAIEIKYGNSPENVSWRSAGYSIESTAPDGTIRYIAVKSISKADYTFCLTNDEHNAAYMYGAQYYICVICKEQKETKAIYIKDPINNVHFEKIIREWDWLCEKYKGVEIPL